MSFECNHSSTLCLWGELLKAGTICRYVGFSYDLLLISIHALFIMRMQPLSLFDIALMYFWSPEWQFHAIPPERQPLCRVARAGIFGFWIWFAIVGSGIESLLPTMGFQSGHIWVKNKLKCWRKTSRLAGFAWFCYFRKTWG